jgi:hypothetical protein
MIRPHSHMALSPAAIIFIRVTVSGPADSQRAYSGITVEPA